MQSHQVLDGIPKNMPKFLKGVIDKLKIEGIRTSIFVDPDISIIEAALETGTDRIELYTENYAKTYNLNRENGITPYILAAENHRIRNWS